MDRINAILGNIRQHGQRQDSTTAQMTDLVHFAKKLGLNEGLGLIGRLQPEAEAKAPVSEYLQPALDGIESQSGDQIGKNDQGTALYSLAKRFGLYDAADLIRKSLVRSGRMAP